MRHYGRFVDARWIKNRMDAKDARINRQIAARQDAARTGQPCPCGDCEPCRARALAAEMAIEAEDAAYARQWPTGPRS